MPNVKPSKHATTHTHKHILMKQKPTSTVVSITGNVCKQQNPALAFNTHVKRVKNKFYFISMKKEILIG